MNELVKIRKFVTITEEVLHDGGPDGQGPRRCAAVLAVVANPYAGRFEPDILPMMEALKPLGLEMSRRLIDALGGDASVVESYGKGAIVGEAGEVEHGALWHAPGGYAMRELLGEAKAIVPSTHKLAGIGARLDVPLHHINAAYVRSHFDSMEIGVTDAPGARDDRPSGLDSRSPGASGALGDAHTSLARPFLPGKRDSRSYGHHMPKSEH